MNHKNFRSTGQSHPRCTHNVYPSRKKHLDWRGQYHASFRRRSSLYQPNLHLPCTPWSYLWQCFLIDNFFAKRTQSLEIYALPQTIQVLKAHFFNNAIWPDFSTIYLPHSTTPAITYKEISLYGRYCVEDGITLTPIPPTIRLRVVAISSKKRERVFYLPVTPFATIHCGSLSGKRPAFKHWLSMFLYPMSLRTLPLKVSI